MSNHIFLEALYGVIHDCPLPREQVDVEEWLECLEIAGIHRMIPVIYPVIAASPAAKKVGPGFFEPFLLNREGDEYTEKAEPRGRGMALPESERPGGSLVPPELMSSGGKAVSSQVRARLTGRLAASIADYREHFNQAALDMRDLLGVLQFVHREGARVNWDALLEYCRSNKLDQIAASIFTIGSKYLGVDVFRYPGTEGWREISVDEGPMLDYLLTLGRYEEEAEEEKNERRRGEKTNASSRRVRRRAVGRGRLSAFLPLIRRSPLEDWEQRRLEMEDAMNRAQLDRRDAVTRGYGLA